MRSTLLFSLLLAAAMPFAAACTGAQDSGSKEPVEVPVDAGPADSSGGPRDVDPSGRDQSSGIEDEDAADPAGEHFGEPCVGNSDCGEGGWCVSGPDGRVCTVTCVDTCPEGFGCAAVEGMGGDLMFLCVPAEAVVCAECVTPEDCPGSAVCAAGAGPEGEPLCLLPCSGAEAHCPDGFGCGERAVAGGTRVWVCVPSGGACCAERKEGALDSCEIENAHGVCPGVRRCRGAEGWSICGGVEPAAEICDGADNDCDGRIDQGLGEGCRCGDGACLVLAGENHRTCPADCAACGDGICSPGENPSLCPTDCCAGPGGSAGCGDGRCMGYACGEDPTTCPADCGTACGDGVCGRGESPRSCARDCGRDACGNGECEPGDGGPRGCPEDCGSACGDCVCEPGEGFAACPLDCGYCGDGTCSPCPRAHEQETCPTDCPGPRDERCNGKDDDQDGETDEETCPDLSPCATSRCDPALGYCVFEAGRDGIPCDDGSACTAEDRCSHGACAGSEPVPCDDGSACTTDYCEPSSGCRNDWLEGPCDDGDPCTLEDMCEEGLCRPGARPACEDGDLCTDDVCDEAGLCSFPYNEAPCDDGNACTDADRCKKGRCVGWIAVECDDGDLCTNDRCEPETGCVFEPSGEPCDDGDACTTEDRCVEGGCAGSEMDCDDSNPCTDDGCLPGSGCTHEPNSEACDDGDACTTGDGCSEGTCASTGALECEDSEPCTDDGCDPSSGCTFEPNTATCEDGDACTENDRCEGGTCRAGAVRECVDSNPCTDDGCDAESGCTHEPNTEACDDGSACTVSDRCAEGSCKGGEARECDDGNPCTDDSCDPGSGCTHTDNAEPCDDLNPCTEPDRCEEGRCEGAGVLDCDDGNPCTTDSCDTRSGCVNVDNTEPCDDGDACTTDTRCRDGACGGGEALPCDDRNPCTDDGCDEGSGCTHTNNAEPCDDQSVCTTLDRCEGGSCKGLHPQDCDDKNPCTDDACDAVDGCLHSANAAPCDDGDACTTQDACAGKACTGGPAPSCDDKNPCTDDGCDSGSGCTNTPNVLPCDDGNACTTQDACAAGACEGGPAPDCDDKNPCTHDLCEAASGCTNPPNSASCDDGNPCTDGDTCSGGSCEPGGPTDCDDGDPCTDDPCDSSQGCLHPHNTAPCQDGDLCTTEDRCRDGACKGGPALVCEDGELCTDDTCVPASGCAFPSNTMACDDGDVCTTADRCAGGACEGGPALDCDDGVHCTEDGCDSTSGCTHQPRAARCDDGNVCTDDACDPQSDCTHTANTEGCDDGDACTVSDRCEAKTCEGGPARSCDDSKDCTHDYCVPATGCENDEIAGYCDDDNPCTIDTLTVHNCSCSNTTLTERVDGDGCCPANANAIEDSDCDPVCGNGVVEPGEHCDTKISSGLDGSCPSTCDDGDVCTLDNHEGTLCEQRCEHPPTPPTDGDLCCPEGANPATDNDCPAMTTAGSAKGVFTTKYAGWKAPVLVPAPNRFFVAASAAQGNGGPVEVSVLDNTGRVLKKHSLRWTGGGGCFETMNPAYNDNRFQMLYSYKCASGHNGTFAPDQSGGSSCIELLEYDLEGNQVSGPLRWGHSAHNGHPTLDWSGSRFGIGWISYDDLLFRQVDASRALMGGDPTTDNLLLGTSPTDDRSRARTRVVYNPDRSEYAVFSTQGSRDYGNGRLYMSRVSATGAKVSGASSRGKAMSECGTGYFAAAYDDDRYYVVYNDYEKVVLQMMSGAGVSEGTVTLSSDDYDWPNMMRVDDRFTVVTQDDTGRTSVTTFDLEGSIVRERTGRLDHGTDELNMPYIAYEPTSASMALIYLNDNNQIVFRSVAFVD